MITSEDIGQLIQYFDDGWYYGYLVSFTKKEVTIQPIGAKGGKNPHKITLPLAYARENVESKRTYKEITI